MIVRLRRLLRNWGEWRFRFYGFTMRQSNANLRRKGGSIMADTQTYAKAQAKLVAFNFGSAAALNQDLSDGWQVQGFSTYGTEMAAVLLVKYQLASAN